MHRRDALSNLDHMFIGFDQLFKSHLVEANTNYPPYNLIQESNNSYVIEVAVAGFKRDEVSVSVDQNKLIIAGDHQSTTEKVNYIKRGLAFRNFKLSFILPEYMVVKSAEIVDGLLTVKTYYEIPETLKPRQIEIR